MTNTSGSRSISSQIPWRIASTSVAWPPRSGRADLCSFLTAVDIVRYSGHLLNICFCSFRGINENPFSQGIYDDIKTFERNGAQQNLFCIRQDERSYSCSPRFEANFN